MWETFTQFGIRIQADPYQLMWLRVEFNSVRLSLVTRGRRDSGIKLARRRSLASTSRITLMVNLASLAGIGKHKLGTLGSFIMILGTNTDRRAYGFLTASLICAW